MYLYLFIYFGSEYRKLGCSRRLRSQTTFAKINCQSKPPAWNFFWGSWIHVCVLEPIGRKINQLHMIYGDLKQGWKNQTQNLSKY